MKLIKFTVMKKGAQKTVIGDPETPEVINALLIRCYDTAEDGQFITPEIMSNSGALVFHAKRAMKQTLARCLLDFLSVIFFMY